MLGVTLRWTRIPSRGEYKYSQSLHATETGDKRRPDAMDYNPIQGEYKYS